MGLPLPSWFVLPRRKTGTCRYLHTTGFFCDPYSEAFREREAGRLDDLDGPQAEFIALHHVGWQFSDKVAPSCVVALPARGPHCMAIGWASVTSLGVNLTYAVAGGSEGRGLARRVTSLALLELDESVGGLRPTDWIHAQYDVGNAASAAVARALGLVADPALEFRCTMPDGRARHFLGARAPAQVALQVAQGHAGTLDVQAMAQGPYARMASPGRRSGWASL